MRPSKQFGITLAVFLIVLFCYGLKRFTLGIDFTDEGAHIAWPMRFYFGEKLFASEPAVLLRPLIAYLSILFKVYPEITLYEFRILGWSIHLLSFTTLSVLLFRLHGAPLLSPLIASIPVFVCNILGLTSPSYYTLSSDFLLIALSLSGLAALDTSRWKTVFYVTGGLALFIATMAHAALGVVAAIILTREIIKNDLMLNLWRSQLTPSNIGILVFVICWVTFLSYVVGTGAHLDWLERSRLFQALTVNPLHSGSVSIIAGFLLFPFAHSFGALYISLAGIGTASAAHVLFRINRHERAKFALGALALLVIVSLIWTFSYEDIYLPTCFAAVSLGLVAWTWLPSSSLLPLKPEIRFLMLLSGIAGLVFAGSTFYYTAHRSWLSGVLGLPFAFAIGLSTLLTVRPRRFKLFSALALGALFVTTACVGRQHYREIFRDAPPNELTVRFKIPKLFPIKSTAERVHAIETLYEYMSSRLSYGESLVTFEHSPMLYYLFDTRSTYGMTWATRYILNPSSLQQLNREFTAHPLPRYAIRTLVDIGNTAWETSPALRYDNYPLNETIMMNYDLEQTIFPFEVWRLKSPP